MTSGRFQLTLSRHPWPGIPAPQADTHDRTRSTECIWQMRSNAPQSQPQLVPLSQHSKREGGVCGGRGMWCECNHFRFADSFAPWPFEVIVRADKSQSSREREREQSILYLVSDGYASAAFTFASAFLFDVLSWYFLWQLIDCDRLLWSARRDLRPLLPCLPPSPDWHFCVVSCV